MLKLVRAVQHLHVVWCGPQSGSLLPCSLLALAAVTTACCGAGGGDHERLVGSGLLFGVLGVRVAGRWPRIPVWQVSKLRGRESEETVYQFNLRGGALAVDHCGAEDAVPLEAGERSHCSRNGVDRG